MDTICKRCKYYLQGDYRLYCSKVNQGNFSIPHPVCINDPDLENLPNLFEPVDNENMSD